MRIKKKLPKLSLSSIVLIIILVVMLILILVPFIKELITKEISGEKKYDYEPQDAEKYKRVYAHVYPSKFDIFGKGLSPFEVPSEEEVIGMTLSNPGFELDLDKNERPDNWYYSGMMEYTSFNCFGGSKCIHIDAVDSDYGHAMINSDPAWVIPGKIYSVFFNIYCVHCENESAYIGVFWMKYYETPLEGYEKVGRFREFRRNILVLNNTDGYKVFNLIARAPEGAEQAIFGVRVHQEIARITPRTELYIDGI